MGTVGIKATTLGTLGGVLSLAPPVVRGSSDMKGD